MKFEMLGFERHLSDQELCSLYTQRRSLVDRVLCCSGFQCEEAVHRSTKAFAATAHTSDHVLFKPRS